MLLVWLALRLLPSGQVAGRDLPVSHLPPETTQSTDAVLIIQSGGRVEYLNAAARQWFDLRPDEPLDLERLARRVRPTDDFLDLCAREARCQISVGGRLAEAVSYQVPGAYPRMLISLRALDFLPGLATEGGEAAGSLIRVIAEFGAALNASPEVEGTLRAILENVGRLVPADALEIKVRVPEEETMAIYRLEEPGPQLRRAAQTQFAGLSDTLLERRRPLAIPDVGSADHANPPENGEARGVGSYIGIPLLVGDELIGALEVGHAAAGALGPSHLELLGMVAGQAAAALHNALLYERERRKAMELSGLANLAQAASAIRESHDLFKRLVESIAPLFEVSVVGFLLYDETKRTLEAQTPYQGLPDRIVEVFRTTIEPGGEAAAVLAAPSVILSADASQDEQWRLLGIRDLAQAASLRDAALVPLISAERLLGYLQLSNHEPEPLSFSASEMRLMQIVADQAAAIIASAVLVQQTRQRALRADGLRRIASLAASSATLDEVLRYSVQELASLFQAEMAAVFLLDEQKGELRLHGDSLVGVSAEVAAPLSALYVQDPQFLKTVTGSQRPFLSGRLSVDRRVLPVYQPLVAALAVESAMVVPLTAHDRSLGELMLGSRKTEFYNNDDLQVAATAATQIAAAIETAALLGQTDESLRRRVEQLSAIARVSRELNATLELQPLLEVIYAESLRITRADCGTILLFAAGNGADEPRLDLSIGCPPAETLSALERQVVARGEPQAVNDYDAEGGAAPHAGVRSALAAPISQQGRTVGLIHLHAAEPSVFDEAAMQAVQVLASQAAIALGNARLYQDQRQRAELIHRRAEALSRLTEISYTLDLEEPLEQSLHTIAAGICDATPFQVVLISVYEPQTGLLRRVTGMGLPQETLADLQAHRQPLSSVEQLLKPEFRISRSYFIPADKTPVVPADVHMVTLELEVTQDSPHAWNANDFLLIPLRDAQEAALGLISLDAPRNGLRPDRATIEALEVFAAQAALVIANHAHLAESRARIESLTSALQRQQRLLSVSQNDLPTLLHKDLEQTISLHNLERRAERIRAGLAITETVSRQWDATSALLALGRETLTQLSMSAALIAEDTAEGPRLVQTLGSVPRATNPEALFGQRNPLRTCLQTGEAILVANLDEDDEWRETPLLSGLRAKSFVCLPVNIGNRPVAAMLAVSPEPMPAFTDEDRQVYFQIARQTSIILQNISLLNETRRRLEEVNLLLDFSRRLSGLDPVQIVTALLESARRVLQVAHAGVVLLWDERAAELIPRAASGYADNEAMMKINYRLREALPGEVFEQLSPRRVDEIHFTRDYALTPENLLLYREATGGRLPVSSLLIPIKAGDQGLGLLVLDNFNTPAAFKPEDEALLLSLSQQVALSLENVRLVQATRERAGQLQALTDVSVGLTSSLQSSELVALLLDQLRPVLPYDTATLWLREKERLVVAAARGFPDSESRLGLTVALSDSALLQEMIRTGQALVVADVRGDPRFPQVEAPRLSWLGVPLISKGEVIGLIALEKWQASFYAQEHVQVGTTFASQAAVALENARLYEDSLQRAAELDQRSQRLALLNRFSSALSGLLDANAILRLTAQELLQALNALRVSLIVFERGQPVWQAALPRVRFKLPRELPAAPLFARLAESLGVFTSDAPASEPDLAPLSDLLDDETASLLALPLVSGADLRAALFVHLGGEGRFRPTEIELARTIANQAAIALENARLYQSTLSTAERFAILNQASAEIGASLDPERIYAAIHSAAARLMPVEAFVIALLDEENNEIEGVYLMDKDERAPNVRLPYGQGLSGRVIATGEPLLIRSPEEAEALGGKTFGSLGTPRSILAVPMTLGGKTLGMLSAQSYQPNAYAEEDRQILSTLANQAIVAIQNGRLFAETQRLAEELEQRVIERTAQLQREQQNTETLLRILTEVSASLDLDRALNRTLALLNEAIGAEQGTIMLLGEDNLLHYRAGYGYLSEKAEQRNRRFMLKIGEGLGGWVVENRKAIMVEDLHLDPRWVKVPGTSSRHRSAVGAPLVVGEDVIGVLMVFHRKTGYFGPEMLNLVKAIASQVAVAINNARLYELIRDQAERLGGMLRREQEEASRSQAILEAVADGVLVTTADNKIAFLNNSAARILSLDPARVYGQSLDDFGGLFGKAVGAWKDTIHRWAEEPSAYQPGDTYAEQLELENGRIVLVHLAPVILQNDFLGTVSIFRDITHEVEVDRLKSEFVATVSHELRTPMTSIKGYVDLLLMGAAGAVNENQSHFLEIVKSNTDRLNILVSDLLDISRIEAGRVSLMLEPLDLRELAEEVLADTLRRSQEDSKPMALSLEAPTRLPPVRGDAERVRQILGNLVDNAYHYTPENGTIIVRLHAPNGTEMQIDVQDDGLGIPAEDQERIFERFYRGENPLVLATPGTGLGLSIVRQLVEMHHGRIWMDSKGIPGQGSTFSFTLPLYQSE